ncbi:MAG: hypothetical protein KY440_11925 [Actinobacteria bacterium]|nr:hypothetical protein [Actinomycetota bacterium]
MTADTGRPSPSGTATSSRGVPGGLALAERPAPDRRKGAARPVPTRNADYAHLSVDALREYRRALTAEENKVSYWRRILQARLDVVQAGSGRDLVQEHLRPLLTSERVGAGRQALVEVLPVDDIPPLPSLGELWDRRVDPGDAAQQEGLEQDLRLAEAQLSSYRNALHRRIGEATGELIARYREQPSLCLTALPLDPRRANASA